MHEGLIRQGWGAEPIGHFLILSAGQPRPFVKMTLRWRGALFSVFGYR
jgi:hypothetical protein